MPVPTNTLVAFTLAGAVLTAVVAGALAVPGGFAGGSDETVAASTNVSDQLDSDAPEPNQDFTPSVRTGPSYGEHDEYEDDEYEVEEEYEDEEHEDGEYENGEDDEYEVEEENEADEYENGAG